MTWKPALQVAEKIVSLAFFAALIGGIVWLTFTDQFPKLRVDWDGDRAGHTSTRVAGFVAKPVWLDVAPPAAPTEWGTGVISERTRILNILDTIEIPGAEPNSEFARGFEFAVQKLTSDIERSSQ